MTPPVGLVLLLLATETPRLIEAERNGLLEFFRSTNGAGWKENRGWGSSEDACNWNGVWCDFQYTPEAGQYAVVAGVSLPTNGLTGSLPARLHDLLPHLRHLDVGGNSLSGVMPEDLLAAWDRHDIELNTFGNTFSNLAHKVRIVSKVVGTLCAVDDDVVYTFEATEGGRAQFESVRCNPATERDTQCLVREGSAPPLDRFSRALKALSYRSLDAAYDYPFTSVTHDRHLSTTVWLGDGSSWSLSTYGREGPIEAWAVQGLFLSLLSEVNWDTTIVKQRCAEVE